VRKGDFNQQVVVVVQAPAAQPFQSHRVRKGDFNYESYKLSKAVPPKFQSHRVRKGDFNMPNGKIRVVFADESGFNLIE